MQKRLLALAGIAGLTAIAAPALAQDSRPASRPSSRPSLPDPKDHEFNEEVPTEFAGEMAELKTAKGVAFAAYMTGPEDSKKALLMIHEWWGLNPHIKGTADAFARLGYRVLAIDLYGGEYAKDPKQARALMSKVDSKDAAAKLKAALTALAKSGRKIGTLGWCFGGGMSLNASLGSPDLVQATCIYYGLTVTDVARLKTLRGPVLGIFAKQDGWITPAKAAAFDKALEAAGVEHAVEVYDADHAFANPSGDRFKRGPARAAWKKTLEFFEKNLG